MGGIAFIRRTSTIQFNCGRGFRWLIYLLMFSQTGDTFAAIPQKKRVAWGGVSFRGHYKNQTLQFPYCSKKDEILTPLLDKLSQGLKSCQNPDCDLLIGQQFDFTAGDRLVASCVLESEDATIIKHDGIQFGQITISASLIVFDFQSSIVVSSLPLGAIYVIEPSKIKDGIQNELEVETFVKNALVGSPGLDTCLAEQVLKRFSSMPIHLRARLKTPRTPAITRVDAA